MPHRCYSSEPIRGDRVLLAGSEAHHLLHVLRAVPGTHVVLFDGSDAEFDAEVAACQRSAVELAIRGRRAVDRELRAALTLGVPLPKGDRQRWIVEKAVELGVTRLAPLATERSIVTSDRRPAGGEKLDRYVIEASKQCGRNRLMEIAAPMSWPDWLAAAPGDSRRWIAHPLGEPLRLASGFADVAGPTYAAVGPEGGLTEAEIEAARAAGWQIVSLGPRILRIETAALTLAAILGTSSGS